MKLTGVELRRISMPLVAPFRTSFGTETHAGHPAAARGARRPVRRVRGLGRVRRDGRPAVLLGVRGRGGRRAQAVLPAQAVRRSRTWTAPSSGRCSSRSRDTGCPRRRSRRRYSTRSCARPGGRSPRELGAVKDRVPCGVSVASRTRSTSCSMRSTGYLAAGYVRIKLKIQPGWDVEPVRAVRERFGDDLLIQVDANTAYTLQDARHLAKLDEFDLLLMEQPLAEEDVLGHAALAKVGPHADLPGRVHHLGADRRRRRSPSAPARSSTSSRAGSAATWRRGASTTSRRRSGIAGLVRRDAGDRASAAPRTSRSPRCPGSPCPATPRPPTGTTRPTSPSRSCCPTGTWTCPPGRASG